MWLCTVDCMAFVCMQAKEKPAMHADLAHGQTSSHTWLSEVNSPPKTYKYCFMMAAWCDVLRAGLHYCNVLSKSIPGLTLLTLMRKDVPDSLAWSRTRPYDAAPPASVYESCGLGRQASKTHLNAFIVLKECAELV